MRLTTVIILGTLMQLSAATFGQQVTVSMRKASLENILKAIRTQSGYDILYDNKDLSGIKPIDMSIQGVSLQQALNSALAGQPLTFSIEGKVVVIKRKETSLVDKMKAYLAEIDIKGKVFDEAGNPMSGATITVKGSGRYTMTNDKGEFTLDNVSDQAILAITYLGYETLEIKAKSDISVSMKPGSAKLEEVNITYNTGYQKISKERATGSFAKPDMKVFSQRTASQDIMSRLDGLVPGLTVISGNAGAYGNEQTGRTQRALVRGTGSVRSTTEPLYVVNGIVIQNFSSINPDDVEDITVLKDAAAAAIWGARAANGVIVVTTKSGSKNQKIDINYSGYVNFQGKPDFDYLNQMSSAQYIQTAREIFNPTAYPSRTLSGRFVAPHERLMYDNADGLISEAAMNRGLDSLASIDNRKQLNDLFYGNTISNNHTLSLGGGNQQYAAYSSFSYTNATGRPGVKNETYKLNLNQTYNPTKFLSLTLFTALNNTLNKSNNQLNIPQDILPYQLFRDAQGNNITMNYVQAMDPEIKLDYEQRSRINLDYTPLDELNYGFQDNNATSINLIGGVGIKIWKGLAFQGNYGFNKSPQTSHRYTDIKSFGMRNQLVNFTVAPTAESTPVYYLPTTGGMYQTGDYQRKDWTVRNQLTYNSRVRDGKDFISVQVGQEAQEQHTSSQYNTLMGYDLDLQSYAAIDYVTLARGIPGVVPGGRARFSQNPTTMSDQKSRFTSYFALANYTFDGKYSMDFSWRQDKSTLIGADLSSQNKPIYSIGGKWEMTKESFMQGISWLNNLGVRATYGITGNSPFVGASSSKDILALENTSTAPPAGYGAHVDQPANGKLNWESTRTINFGINFDVFDSKLSGNIDMYDRKTTNLLAVVVMNPFLSFGSSTGNLGSLSNRGIELGLSTKIFESKDFNWNTSLTFSYNYNKLLSYEEDPIALSYATAKVAASYLIGHSMSSLFAYQYAGLDAMGDPLVRLNDGTVTKERNVASPDDIVYMGTTVPKFNGGLLNSFGYKGFTLSANIGYNFGHVMRSETNDFFTGRLTGNEGSFSGNINSIFNNRWKVPGDEARTDIPAYVAGNANNNRRELSYYSMGDTNVESASYIKLRDISLGYNLPASMLRAIHLSSVRVFFQANNFLLWTANNDGIDPEFYGLTNGGRSLPPFKHSFSLGTNISF